MEVVMEAMMMHPDVLSWWLWTILQFVHLAVKNYTSDQALLWLVTLVTSGIRAVLGSSTSGRAQCVGGQLPPWPAACETHGQGESGSEPSSARSSTGGMWRLRRRMVRTFHRIELLGIRRTSDHQERRVSLRPVESKMKNLCFEETESATSTV